MGQKIGWWCCRATDDAAPKAGGADNSKAHRVQRWAFCFAFRAERKLRCVDAMVGVCENKETA